MNQAEFEQAMQNTCETVQVFRLEPEEGGEFSLLVRFPPGHRAVRFRTPVPGGQLLDPNLCVQVTAHVRHQLMRQRYEGDAGLVNYTNWTSLIAAVQRHIIEFNNAQTKDGRLMSAIPGAVPLH